MLACYGSRYISLRFKTLLQPRGPRLRSVRAHVHPEVPLTERRQRVRRPVRVAWRSNPQRFALPFSNFDRFGDAGDLQEHAPLKYVLVSAASPCAWPDDRRCVAEFDRSFFIVLARATRALRQLEINGSETAETNAQQRSSLQPALHLMVISNRGRSMTNSHVAEEHGHRVLLLAVQSIDPPTTGLGWAEAQRGGLVARLAIMHTCIALPTLPAN